MKKIISYLAYLLCAGSLIFGLMYMVYHLHKKENSMHDNLGKQVIIDNDTLTILTSDWGSETYTLSNGRAISDKIIEQFKIKE